MRDGIYDTNVVVLSNGDLAGRKPGNSLDRRLRVLELCVTGERRPRYNRKLLGEYQDHVRRARNDVVELFMELLDRTGVFVKKSTVSRQVHSQLITIGWQSHDQHLVAAALGGERPEIFTTEERLAGCCRSLKRAFGIQVSRV